MKKSLSTYICIYLFITFALGILLSIIIGSTGGHESHWKNLGFVSMLIPAIAVSYLKVIGEPVADFGLNRFSVKWAVLAILFFPVLIHAFCLPLFAIQHEFSLPWQAWLTKDRNGFYHAPPEKNWGVLTKGALIFHILLNAFAGLVTVSFLAYFEEIGWRAWLLPRLILRFNLKKGILITAVIVALWHVPFVLCGLHYIENVRMPLMVSAFLCGQLGAGIILSWFWLKTKSIWIVSLAHGSLNNWGQYAFKYMNDARSVEESIELIVTLNFSLLLAGLIVFWMIRKNAKIQRGL